VTSRPGRDRGSADALGLALIAPAAIGLALVIVFLGRGVDGRATAQTAAESAAQAAAQERTPGAARAAAEQVTRSMLVDDRSCASPSVDVDTSRFEAGGTVGVTVTCSTSTDGLEPIRPPRGRSYRVTAVAAIDPFRATGDG
jgi:Flp pilus assembly protein TadG